GLGLHVSNNRLCFSPDGRSLYVGQTARGWGMSKASDTEGMQRITWLGGTPFTVEAMNITAEGFRLTFTEPLAPEAARAANFDVLSMQYQSRWIYGGDPRDRRAHDVSAIRVLDERTVALAIAGFAPGRIYRL